MADVRRYSDDEVAEILAQAATEDTTPSTRAAGAGLSLAELQDIGVEVGLSPDRIRDAALALERGGGRGGAGTVMGLPRAVSRVVSIPRALTDHEWTRLVVDLRETFNAKGRIESHGLLRSWTNGNLQVHVEPEAEGYRVRMQTMKSDAAAMVGFSAFFVVLSLAMLVVLMATGSADAGLLALTGLLGLVGLAAGVNARLLLPRWAGERTTQMEGLAERIPRLLSESDEAGHE